MKKLLLKTMITACLLLLMRSVNSQIKNLHDVAHKIPDSLVQQKIIGADTVTYIDESLLKEKYNVVTLGSSRYLYIEYLHGYVRGVLISDDNGRVTFRVAYQQKLEENAGYFPAGCHCVGVKSCEEMFAKGLYPNDKICVGNTCVATRPFNAKEDLEKWKEQKKGNQ